MADERSFDDGKRAENLKNWEIEIRPFKDKIFGFIKKNLGNCSNREFCVKDVFEMALFNVSAVSVTEVQSAKNYLITAAVHLAWKYPKREKCSACSNNFSSLCDEDNSPDGFVPGSETGKTRRNGRTVPQDQNNFPQSLKDQEDRRERHENVKYVRSNLSELKPHERDFLMLIFGSKGKYEEKLPEIRKIYPGISIGNVRRKVCYLKAKLRKIIMRGKNE